MPVYSSFLIVKIEESAFVIKMVSVNCINFW